MIKHLLNSVITKYRGFQCLEDQLFASCRSQVICSPLTHILSSTEWSETNAAQKKTCALIHCADFPCNVLSYNSLKMLICNNCFRSSYMIYFIYH